MSCVNLCSCVCAVSSYGLKVNIGETEGVLRALNITLLLAVAAHSEVLPILLAVLHCVS